MQLEGSFAQLVSLILLVTWWPHRSVMRAGLIKLPACRHLKAFSSGRTLVPGGNGRNWGNDRSKCTFEEIEKHRILFWVRFPTSKKRNMPTCCTPVRRKNIQVWEKGEGRCDWAWMVGGGGANFQKKKESFFFFMHASHPPLRRSKPQLIQAAELWGGRAQRH